MKRFALAFGLAATVAGLLLGPGAASAQVSINEIRTDDPGNPDTDEYFELRGPPGGSLAGLTYIVIGDASAGACGVIESVVDLGAWSLQADGLLCLRNSNFTGTPLLTGYDGAVPMAFENSDNVTHMLISGFTGALGQDLDTNDDGVLDVTPWTAVVDCLGLDEGTAPNCVTDERLYCGTRIGPDGTFVPSHVYRYGDTQVWAMGMYQPVGTTDTPGEPNFTQFSPPPVFANLLREPCVPTPGQPVTVTAVVDNAPTVAELRYRVNGGAETVVPMDVYGQVGDSVFFFTQVPGQTGNGTRVDYTCHAWNGNPDGSASYQEGYFVGTTNVADLRVNDPNGKNLYRYYGARVRGRVTSAYDVFSGANTDFNLQDATGGINVFKYGPHAVHPSLGDDITVAGSLDQYNGRLELSAVGSCDSALITVHGPGAPPAPLALSLCDLREEHEGMLVKVQNLVIHNEDAVFAANRNYKTANCFSDSLEMFVDADTDIPGHAITSNHMDVVGIAGQYDSSSPYTWWYQVQPRSMADITFLSMTSAPVPEATGEARLWPCAPTPSTGSAEIRYEVPARGAGGGAVPVRLAVYDLRGRLVTTLVSGPVPPGVHTATLDREALGGGSGIYFCRLQVGVTAITRKLVMLRP